MTLDELNEIAISTVNSLARDHGFKCDKDGWTKAHDQSRFQIEYTILGPNSETEYRILGNDYKLSFVVGVKIKELQNVIRQFLPTGRQHNAFTLFTGSTLICQKLAKLARVNRNTRPEEFRQSVSEFFTSFIDCCEKWIARASEPENLLAQFKKPTMIFFTKELLIKEIALQIFHTEFENALEITALIPGGIAGVVTSEDVAHVREYIERQRNFSADR